MTWTVILLVIIPVNCPRVGHVIFGQQEMNYVYIQRDVSQMFSGIFLLKKSHNGVDWNNNSSYKTRLVFYIW